MDPDYKMNAKKFGTAACTALLKTILLAFNLIFFAIGLAFLVIGIYGYKVFSDFFQFAPSSHIYIPLICIGITMMGIGLLSLWCTPKGVSWLLYLYGAIIFVLFVAIFSISVLFMVKRDAFETTLKTSIDNSIKNYPKEKESIDLLQSTIKCCGLENYADWFTTTWANKKNSVPDSCCKVQNKLECNHENLGKNLTDIYQQGCYSKVYNTIEENYGFIGGIGFASSLIIFGGSLLSCALASNIKKNKYEEME